MVDETLQNGRGAGAPVLTHPAFSRPAVKNPHARRAGRKELEGVAVLADRRQLAVHDLVHELAGDRTRTREEREVIRAGLALLDRKLRRPGAVIGRPSHVHEYLALHLAHEEREVFAVLFLDAGCALIELRVMFAGTLTQTSVYPREVVRAALELNAAAVILAHNHPSGNPEPSRADEYLTQTLKNALALVEVRVLDHVVIGRLQSVSMAERGLL